MLFSHSRWLVIAIAAIFNLVSASVAQDSQKTFRPLSKKQLAAKQKIRQQPLSPGWRSWLSDDVLYIISDEEKMAFRRLHTDAERQQFVDQFWLRRDPTPGTQTNEFKEEHYRRIAYADDRFSGEVRGSRTDRGSIYIRFGPPDEIDRSGALEIWRYRHLKGGDHALEFNFVDEGKSGDYHITADSAAALANLAPSGPTLVLAESVSGTVSSTLFTSGFSAAAHSPSAPRPIVKFTDLEAAVNSGIYYNALPIVVRADSIRITAATTLTDVAIQFQNHELPYVTRDHISRASVNLYGRVQSATSGQADWFEETITSEGVRLYSKGLLLAPGTYRLNIAARDTASNAMGTFATDLVVPFYGDQQLASSSIVVADSVQREPAPGVDTRDFVLRTTRVRPRVGNTFKRSETIGIYAEFYNFGMNEKSGKLDGSVELAVIDNATNRTVLSGTDDLTTIPNASPFLVTLVKKLPLRDLPPGQYTLKATATDRSNNSTIAPSVRFSVTM